MPEYTRLEIGYGGEYINLSNGTTYLHIANDGFGAPPIQRYTESGALQDGSTDVGFKLNPRILNITTNILADNREEYWSLRDQLLYILAPREDPLQLRVTKKYYAAVPDATQDPGESGFAKRTRTLDCYLTSGLTYSSDGKQGNYNGHRVSFELTAPNPVWYDPTQRLISFGDNMFASGELDEPLSVIYNGTWKTYPIITLYGPLDDLVITNSDTGDVLDFTGFDIPDYTVNPTEGVVTVDCRYGYKTITNAGATNLINKLSPDSDLATFSLQPDPLVEDGINTLTVTATNDITSISYVIFTYYDRFIGL